MSELPLTSTKPYLIRAIYEWILDNDLTPHVLVNTELPNVVVPEQHVENGKIVLNISPQSVSDLHQDNEWILFNARFSGKSMEISIPISAVIAIYARENGCGIVLEEDGGGPPPDDTPAPTKKLSKPHLQLVK